MNALQTLRHGSSGPLVEAWQYFLHGQGFDPGVVDGRFGARTKAATVAFQQRHGLVGDGIAGNRTIGQAMLVGFQGAEDVDEDPAKPDRASANWPPRPDFAPLVGTGAREAAFGEFAYQHDPTPGNPERIVVTDDWAKDNIDRVEIPQLVGVPGAPASGNIYFYRPAHSQLQALWQAWEDHDLIDRLVNWGGSYAPRFIRGSDKTLSNHAFGTAFDINTRGNPLGALPALVGRYGSVRELVSLANEHGFYWGGHCKNRPDGMHFEVAALR
ncbi:MAG: M15 family metallopeptidase [Alphaproteobacteria bacterium]|nr:M15 family metallopeptidase [Alphaproteobacteria bacterium]